MARKGDGRSCTAPVWFRCAPPECAGPRDGESHPKHMRDPRRCRRRGNMETMSTSIGAEAARGNLSDRERAIRQVNEEFALAYQAIVVCLAQAKLVKDFPLQVAGEGTGGTRTETARPRPRRRRGGRRPVRRPNCFTRPDRDAGPGAADAPFRPADRRGGFTFPPPFPSRARPRRRIRAMARHVRFCAILPALTRRSAASRPLRQRSQSDRRRRIPTTPLIASRSILFRVGERGTPAIGRRYLPYPE